jgi:hypothetical protein
VSDRGFEASDPVVAVSRDGRHAAGAWIEARAGHLQIGLVRARSGVQHLRLRDVGQPVELSVGIDDAGRVTLAETVQRGARHVLVVQRLDAGGVASAPEFLSDAGADALSPLVVDRRSAAFVVWKQFDATASSIHVKTAEPGRKWNERVVLRSDWGALGTPKLAAGPDGITLAWPADGGGTTAVMALSLDPGGQPLGPPVVLASNLREGVGVAVAGDGRTVVVTPARADLPVRVGPVRVARVEHGSKRVVEIVAPAGWREAGPAVPVLGAPLLAVPLVGPRGKATLLQPLDTRWRRRVVSGSADGRVVSIHDGMSLLRVGGSRQAGQIVLQPLRS